MQFITFRVACPLDSSVEIPAIVHYQKINLKCWKEANPSRWQQTAAAMLVLRSFLSLSAAAAAELCRSASGNLVWASH
jgi:hypothetical protein